MSLAYKNLEIINNSRYQFCKNCNYITPHTVDNKCKVCETNEYVWCNKCNKFETIERNSIPYHWLFYKAKTRKWIKQYPKQFEYIQSIIDDINNLQNLKPVRGIYLWRIDKIPYYCGDSEDILSRLYDHCYEIQNNSEYWLNIINEVKNGHTISLEVLEECDISISNQEMHNIQIKWINELKPMSQKCDGTDHIIPLNQRNYYINNLKEMYDEKLKLFNNKEESLK